MDNLCHTLTGAAIGEAGLKQRTRFGMATLLVAANLPDLDVLVFATDIPSVAFRRGWTHGVLAQAVLPLALTALMVALDRLRPRPPDAPPARAGWLLALSLIGIYSHVGLDWMNNYGVRLLAPVDWRWFYGDTLFIVDPWLWASLGFGVWRARKRGTARAARGALGFATAYVLLMLLSAQAARDAVADVWRGARGREPHALMVGPVPVSPFSRDVIIDAGDHYETGTFRWWSAAMTFDAARVPKQAEHPAVAAAREAPPVRGFLVWSRFPFWTIEPAADGVRVTVRDMRFAGRGARFEASTVVPASTPSAPSLGR